MTHMNRYVNLNRLIYIYIYKYIYIYMYRGERDRERERERERETEIIPGKSFEEFRVSPRRPLAAGAAPAAKVATPKAHVEPATVCRGPEVRSRVDSLEFIEFQQNLRFSLFLL